MIEREPNAVASAIDTADAKAGSAAVYVAVETR